MAKEKQEYVVCFPLIASTMRSGWRSEKGCVSCAQGTSCTGGLRAPRNRAHWCSLLFPLGDQIC